MALDLLSLEDSGGSSQEKIRGRVLTAAVLQSNTSLWKHKVILLSALGLRGPGDEAISAYALTCNVDDGCKRISSTHTQ